MKKSSKYDTSGLIENQFESGSNKRVLRNLLAIKSKREMDEIEALEHAKVFIKLIRLYGKSHRFNAKDICNTHKAWLGSIYSWAGSYRLVNISKGNFSFAGAKHIPQLMAEFEKETLARYTPCTASSIDNIVEALAVVHVELVLIHPFREGNGRLARLLSVLMAFQAGLPTLDFNHIRGKKREEYFSAVRKGLDKDYLPMKKIFKEVIERTIRRSSQRL